MATKKTTKKSVTPKASAKKASTKKSPAKKTAAKPKTNKKASAKKAPDEKAAPKKTASTNKAAKKEPVGKFYLYDEEGKKYVPAEKAKPVKVAGFEKFSFFMHTSVNGKGWTISEATCGARIASGDTQTEVKAKAKTALNKYGKQALVNSIKQTIDKNGVAPGQEALQPEGWKTSFTVTTDDGTEVEVSYNREFQNHLEFKGEITSTGYRSHFGYDGSGEVKEAAQKIANEFRTAFLKEQARATRKTGKKSAAKEKAPKITQELKDKLLAVLAEDKKQGRPQSHFSDLVKATGSSEGDVAAALMVMELEHQIKSLPGKFHRLLKTKEQKPAQNTSSRGGKPKGKMSMLDAAAQVLKEAKQPLTVKEITQRIFEQNLSATEGRTPHATLSAAMGREIKAKGAQSRFRRADRGLFELNA